MVLIRIKQAMESEPGRYVLLDYWMEEGEGNGEFQALQSPSGERIYTRLRAKPQAHRGLPLA